MNRVNAQYPNGKWVRAWRANEERGCAGCSRTIKAGEIYTNHHVYTDGHWYPEPGYYPFCTTCFPVIDYSGAN